MTPELVPSGGGPRSRYRMELPASQQYHRRVAHQAAELGWPPPAEALAPESPRRLAPESPRRAERSPTEPEPSPRTAPPASPRNFFAGFAERGGADWEPVDARGQPLAFAAFAGDGGDFFGASDAELTRSPRGQEEESDLEEEQGGYFGGLFGGEERVKEAPVDPSARGSAAAGWGPD